MDQLERDLQAIIDQTPGPAGNETKISAPFRLLLPVLQKILAENSSLLARVVALEKELTEAKTLHIDHAAANNGGSAELIANVEKVRSELEEIKADVLFVKQVPSSVVKMNSSGSWGNAKKLRSSLPSTSANNQADAESTQPEKAWSTVLNKAIRGSVREVPEETSAPKQKMLQMASLKHEPFMDFSVRGLPRLEATEHTSIANYSEYVKSVLVENGFKVRFVTVFKVPEGSKRGTTTVRIGSYVSERSNLMDGDSWPPNCLVQPWQYRMPLETTDAQQLPAGPKNLKRW